jgi:hypothetical protein
MLLLLLPTTDRRSLTTLAGRLGFEPRQSAPKALDLPLVDRPVLTDPSTRWRSLRISPAGSRFAHARKTAQLDLPLVDRPETRREF